MAILTGINLLMNIKINVFDFLNYVDICYLSWDLSEIAPWDAFLNHVYSCRDTRIIDRPVQCSTGL